MPNFIQHFKNLNTRPFDDHNSDVEEETKDEERILENLVARAVSDEWVMTQSDADGYVKSLLVAEESMSLLRNTIHEVNIMSKVC